MAKRSWKRVHKSSGATVIERGPKGAARWAVSCNGDHDRGSSTSVARAKTAATRAAKRMKKG